MRRVRGTRSQEVKLLAAIVMATLLIGIFISPAIHALITSNATLNFSGTITDLSGTSGVLGYTDATYAPYGSDAVSMGNGPGVYVIPLVTPCSMTVTAINIPGVVTSGVLGVPVIYSDSDTLLYNGSGASLSDTGWTSIPVNCNLLGGTTYYFGIMINSGTWTYGTDQSTSGTYDDWSNAGKLNLVYPDPPATYSTDSVLSGTMSLYANYTTTLSPPTYSGLSTSTTVSGVSCTFSATFNDGIALQPDGQYSFGTNNTGIWTWQPWTNFTSTPQTETYATTLNSNVGYHISYEWNFTDNAHMGGNQTTGIQTITTTTLQPPTYSNLSFSSTINATSCTFSATFNDAIALQPNGQYTFGTNNTGSWVWQGWTSFTTTPQTETVTQTLNSHVGYGVSYMWNFTDNADTGGNQTTGIQTFTITSLSSLSLHTSGTEILNANDQSFYLKGVGIWSFAPSNIWWGTSGSDVYADQWQTGAALNTSLTQTFSDLQNTWGVNMVRLFFYPEWWWQGNVTPSIESGTGWSSTPVNVRLYFQIVCQIAEQYGIYVDFVPYQLTAQTGAYSNDPYLDAGGGVPMAGDWDSTQQAFLTSTGFATEQQFWSAFWGNMSLSLANYPNAIFEAWNEPQDQDTSPNTVTSGYLSYLTTMYSAIRSTGSTNLIFMQYQVGWEPNGWGENLSWASQIAAAIGIPTNLVFTTHIYYYSPSDLTQYWDSNGLDSDAGGIPYTETQLQTIFTNLQSSMGVSAPLVFNEAGDCSYYATNIANDYVWWNNFCQASYADGIGVGAYYFDRNYSAGGVGGVNMGLISTAPYTPSVPFGTDFIADSTSGASTVGTDLTAGLNQASFSVLPLNVTFSSILSGIYQLDTWTGTEYETATTINAIIPNITNDYT